jgi:hypothetical protein
MNKQRAIRAWLLGQPRPSKLRLTTGENAQELVVPETNPNWAKVATSVEAIDPDIVEVYDATGKLLRAAKRDTFEVEAIEEDVVDKSAGAALKLAADAETARFKIFADHLAHAYEFATNVAFERMVDLFGAVNRRSETQEKSLETMHKMLARAYQDQVDQALEHAEESAQDPLSTLVAGFANGVNQGAVDKVSAAVNPGNGKAKAKA